MWYCNLVPYLRRDQLTMGYFGNFDNGSKKIEKKIEKFNRCVLLKIEREKIDDHSNFMQFHNRLIVHQRSLIWNYGKLFENLTVFDELLNDNEII
jgi:hypothetical protein